MTVKNAEPLSPIPVTISATEGAKFSGLVGSFVDGNPNALSCPTSRRRSTGATAGPLRARWRRSAAARSRSAA